MQCIICESEKTNTLNKFNTYAIEMCIDCGTIFTDIVLDSKSHYTRSYSKTSLVRRNLATIAKKITSMTYYDYINKHVPLNEIRSVLEIGSDRGHFIKLFEDKGIDTLGIEPNDTAVSSSVAKNLKLGFFDENYITNKTFDLICFTQNISYFRDNLRILEKAASLLNPNGYIFIATVNADSKRVIDHFAANGNPLNTACIISKKIWHTALKNIGFDLIDYSLYEPSMFLDIYNRRWYQLPKYLIFRSTAYYQKHDGYHNFILLKKRDS